MTPEESAEKWKEICFILSTSVKKDMNEKEFEYHVVKAVETLGWKEYKKEIKRQPVIKIGHGKKLQPDLVVYDDSGEPLMAIEVKRPAEDLTKGDVSSQLKSYMLMLKTEYGLLIGKTIRFFYDGDLYTSKGPVLLAEFKFDEKSEKGKELVSNINKESLCQSTATKYIKKLIKKIQEKLTIKELLRKLLSTETKNIVLDKLRNEFSGDYGPEIVEGALNFVDIQINRKVSEKPPLDGPVPKQNPKTIKGKVLNLIQSSPAGISKKEICNKLSLSDKQVANIIYRFKKHGQIKKTDTPGVWAATHSPPNQKPPKTPPKPTKKTLGLRGKVLKCIAKYKNGASPAKIKERTGFNKKQVSNSIYRLKKTGLITLTETGLYKAI